MSKPSIVHSDGGTLLATVMNVKHTGAAMEYGADSLMVTGHGAAAHGGMLHYWCSERSPETLFAVCDCERFGDSTGIRSRCCGDGIMVRHLEKSLLAGSMKQAVILASESDTIYGSNPARVLSLWRTTIKWHSHLFIVDFKWRVKRLYQCGRFFQGFSLGGI